VDLVSAAVANHALTPRAHADPGAPPAVVVERLSKRFALPHHRYNTLKERALHPVRTRRADVLEAVKDANFTIGEGEFFGIVGRNGSGKSTLLKCLAGIYQADAGQALVRGRLSPFIELGVGLNPEMTARENVLINAVMLGLTRREARRRFDEIIAFAELEDFLDLKLKNYSSGMSVRLAFSVAIQVDADILLVDEVLAVGDARFQQKCFDAFYSLKAAGRTIVFVTHDMFSVERFCDRALLMEKGRIVTIDEPRVIARAYNELNFGQIVPASGVTPSPDGAAQILDGWFEDANASRTGALAQDEAMRICVEVEFHEPVENPWFSVHLRNEARHVIFVSGSTMHLAESGHYSAGDRAVVRIGLQNCFAPGRYQLSPTVARPTGQILDVREDISTVVVHGNRHTGGVVDLPHTFELQR
jgi:ABC-type polysaccharide/polyol phosphate transport system ATPase subunit